MKMNLTSITLAIVLGFGAAIIFWPAQTSYQENTNSGLSAPVPTEEDEVITLIGASQFPEEHVYTRTTEKFEELVQKYYDKPVKFETYLNSELGLEKDFFTYMSLGIAVDYAIVTASHMSTFAREAPLIDTPFLFRDLEHWKKVVSSDLFQPVEEAVYQQADVKIIGYAGGGVRNLIVNRPVRNMEELHANGGVRMRVMGAPIQADIFQAIGAVPSVIAYNEIYSAIQTGVIEAAENEASGLEQMKFYEVGPEIALTQHAFTLRPLAFSGKTLRRLPPDLQDAIRRAGREAGEHGRQVESALDASILERLQGEGLLTVHPFTQREELLQLVKPIKEAYAKTIGAEEILARINAVQ